MVKKIIATLVFAAIFLGGCFATYALLLWWK